MTLLLDQDIKKLHGSAGQEGKFSTLWIFVALSFCLALIPAVLHNLYFCESRIMLSTDGKHFLHTVSLLVEYVKSYAGTNLAQNFMSESQLAGHIIFDGPVMSLFYAPVFCLLDKIPTARDWTVLACGQSLFHALSAVLVFLSVFRLTGTKLFATIAAALYALYPPAVLQTGHFMSEIPVCFLLLCLLSLLACSRRQFLAFALAGICSALVALAKPALLPGLLLVCFYAIVVIVKDSSETRKSGKLSIWSFLNCRRNQIAGILLGALLTLFPWFVFSLKNTGSVFTTAQRQPLYNVVTGWNTEADGWAFSPHPPFTDLFTENDGPLPTAMGVWISRPYDSLRLAYLKLSRMIAFPWNDFKGRALGLDVNAQLLWHRLILSLAIFGAGIYFFGGRRNLKQEQRRLLELSGLLFAIHLFYLMVESQPRYLFTGFPFLLIFAVYGIWQAANLPLQDKSRRMLLGLSVAVALSAAGLLLQAEDICARLNPRALFETSHLLARLDRVEKNIDLSKSIKAASKNDIVILLVDGDKNLEQCSLRVNGHLVDKTLLPAMHFDSVHYALYDQFREFAPSMRVSVDDFRQWRAVPIDATLINWQGQNTISLQNFAKNATIYADKNPTRYAYSIDYCSYGRLAGAPIAAGAESRFIEPVVTAKVMQDSFVQRKGEAAIRLADSLRVKLLLIRKPGTPEPSLQSAGTMKLPASANLAISRKSFDRMLWDNDSSDCLRINKVRLYGAATVASELPIPAIRSSSHLRLCIKGELRALNNAGEVGLLCALKGENGSVQILGKTPRALNAQAEWRRFRIDDIVPLAGLGGKAEKLELALYPCPWMEGQYGVSRRACDALFRNISVELTSKDLPAISGTRVIY